LNIVGSIFGYDFRQFMKMVGTRVVVEDGEVVVEEVAVVARVAVSMMVTVEVESGNGCWLEIVE